MAEAVETMQQMYLRAAALLLLETSPARELLASGVQPRSVLALYPHDFVEWAPRLTQLFRSQAREDAGPEMIWRGDTVVHNPELHGRLCGLDQRSWKLKELPQVRLPEAEQLLREFFATAAGVELLSTMGFEPVRTSDMSGLIGMLLVLDSLISIASRWPELSQLHRHERDYRELVEASLSALLPQHFQLSSPPMRLDTMMFR